MITFFKSQKDLAESLIELIDDYWNHELSEQDLISQINVLISKNLEKTYLDGDYTSVLKQRLGKRRIVLLDKILKQTGDK
jgi:uncharacterized protein (TIGR04540 family)